MNKILDNRTIAISGIKYQCGRINFNEPQRESSELTTPKVGVIRKQKKRRMLYFTALRELLTLLKHTRTAVPSAYVLHTYQVSHSHHFRGMRQCWDIRASGYTRAQEFKPQLPAPAPTQEESNAREWTLSNNFF